MKNSHIPDGDTLVNEVKIELNMFRTLMLDGVGGEVHGADVIIVDRGVNGIDIIRAFDCLKRPIIRPNSFFGYPQHTQISDSYSNLVSIIRISDTYMG
jgi:hypothetical protein